MTTADETALLARGNRLVGWLLAQNYRNVDWIPFALRGSGEVESRVDALIRLTESLCAAHDKPCEAELIPALLALEGACVDLEFRPSSRRLSCLIGRRQIGNMVYHVAKQDENDPGEPLTFGDFRVVQVIMAARAA
jgi:hypothetical protein